MKTYNLILYTSCVSIRMDKWDELMKGTKPCSGELLRNRIKRYLPELYNALALNYYNPFESQCRHKKGLFVYVHSAIEYFIKY